MGTRRQHFVTFLSPGTFISEQTTRPIDAWSPSVAARMAGGVVERYGAKPYGFYFSTSLVADPVPDGEGGTLKVQGKEVERSGMYFLGGTLLRYDYLTARKDKSLSILLANMLGNGYPIVVETTNGYRSTHPFGQEDCVVDAAGKVVERGDDPKHVAYRATVIERHRREMEEKYPTLAQKE